MSLAKIVVLCAFFIMNASAAYAEKITIAAAADLKYAMDDIVTSYTKRHPTQEIEVVYGSSGKFHTQLQQGAPYDIFFSADISYPQELKKSGFAASEVVPYAFGRIVLWSAVFDATKMTLESLQDQRVSRVAIANPKHAPYGKRAEEALKAKGLWEKIEPKLIFGDNIAHTAQFVETENAQVGIIALSLAVNKSLSDKGGYWLIPDTLHEPLEQGFIVTKRAADNHLAKEFAEYMSSKDARTIMTKYGFLLPGETVAQ